MKIPDYKAALFDLDGTLLHTMRYWRIAPMEFALAHDFYPTTEEFNRMYLTSSRILTAEMCEKRGIKLTAEQIGAELEAFVYHHYLYDAKPKTAAFEFLKHEYNRGIPMCIATGSPANYAVETLKRFGILELFQFVAGGKDYAINKGDPDYFRMMADKLGTKPEELCVFEDALYSIRAAKTAGCKVIAIEEPTQALTRSDIIQIADLYIHSYTEIPFR